MPPNGVIIVLEDYLFMDEYHGDVEGSESQLFSAIPMVTASDGSDHFPMIELGTAHDDDHSDGYTITTFQINWITMYDVMITISAEDKEKR